MDYHPLERVMVIVARPTIAVLCNPFFELLPAGIAVCIVVVTAEEIEL